jgi:hypothetical protein
VKEKLNFGFLPPRRSHVIIPVILPKKMLQSPEGNTEAPSDHKTQDE